MAIFFKVVGIVMFFALSVYWAFFALRFPKSIRLLPNDENDNAVERNREKVFYKKLFEVLVINLIASILAVGDFVGNYFVSEDVPFLSLPIIILVVGGLVYCVLLMFFFYKIAKKYKIKNYDRRKKTMVPIQSLDKGILGLSLFIGYMYSMVFANAIYMLLLLVK